MKKKKKLAAVLAVAAFVVTGTTACSLGSDNAATSNAQLNANVTTANNQSETTRKNENGYDIGEEKAKSIAFSHANVKESEVSGLRVDRDLDDGRLEYQVEFYVGNKEYNYEISGEDGNILDYDVDIEDRD